MMKEPVCTLLAAFALMASTVHAKDQALTSPQAGARTYAQNYKDMVLATCIANAYKNDKGVAIDAGSSVSALRDWTSYDFEKSHYHNPLVEAEIKGVRFDLLKCLDLYHGRELDAQVKRLVINPKRTYRQDNPPRAGPKRP